MPTSSSKEESPKNASCCRSRNIKANLPIGTSYLRVRRSIVIELWFTLCVGLLYWIGYSFLQFTYITTTNLSFTLSYSSVLICGTNALMQPSTRNTIEPTTDTTSTSPCIYQSFSAPYIRASNIPLPLQAIIATFPLSSSAYQYLWIGTLIWGSSIVSLIMGDQYVSFPASFAGKQRKSSIRKIGSIFVYSLFALGTTIGLWTYSLYTYYTQQLRFVTDILTIISPTSASVTFPSLRWEYGSILQVSGLSLGIVTIIVMINTCIEFTKYLRLTSYLQYLSPKTVSAGTFEPTVPIPFSSSNSEIKGFGGNSNFSSRGVSSATLLSLDPSSELMELSIDAALVKFSTLSSGAQIKLLTWLLQLNERIEWREPILSVLRHIVSIDFNSVSGKRLLLSFIRIHNRMIDNTAIDIFIDTNNDNNKGTDPMAHSSPNPTLHTKSMDESKRLVPSSLSLSPTGTGLTSSTEVTNSVPSSESPDIHSSSSTISNRTTMHDTTTNFTAYDPAALGYTRTSALQRAIQRYKLNTPANHSYSPKPMPPTHPIPRVVPFTPNQRMHEQQEAIMRGNPIGGAVYLRQQQQQSTVANIETETTLPTIVSRPPHRYPHSSLGNNGTMIGSPVVNYSLGSLNDPSINVDNTILSDATLARRTGIVSALASLPVFENRPTTKMGGSPP